MTEDQPPTEQELDELREGVLRDIEITRADIEALRADAREQEVELAEHIREALGYGLGVSVIARAAGLSRERIYQIRDGRR